MKLPISSLLLCLILPTNSFAQKTPFSPSDALKVQSLNIREMTDDLKFLILTSGTRKDRMNTDHKRFRDPSYVNSRLTTIQMKSKVYSSAIWQSGNSSQLNSNWKKYPPSAFQPGGMRTSHIMHTLIRGKYSSVLFMKMNHF